MSQRQDSHNSRAHLPSCGVSEVSAPHRLRRLHRVWPDRDGNISYLLTVCVDGRGRVLDNETTFERLITFLLESPARYQWFGRRFVLMPDHVHIIARQGRDAVPVGGWIKALKAVVGGLKLREASAAILEDVVVEAKLVGPVSSPGAPKPKHRFERIRRAWRWQDGYHDHKFRTPEAESRKWEYICLNPVRAGLVKRPEEWPFGGEIFYDEAGGPKLVRGTPPLLETGTLTEELKMETPPREGTRPTGRTVD